MSTFRSKEVQYSTSTHRVAEWQNKNPGSRCHREIRSSLCLAGWTASPAPGQQAEDAEDAGRRRQEGGCVDNWHSKEKVVWGTVLHSYFIHLYSYFLK